MKFAQGHARHRTLAQSIFCTVMGLSIGVTISAMTAVNPTWAGPLADSAEDTVARTLNQVKINLNTNNNKVRALADQADLAQQLLDDAKRATEAIENARKKLKNRIKASEKTTKKNLKVLGQEDKSYKKILDLKSSDDLKEEMIQDQTERVSALIVQLQESRDAERDTKEHKKFLDDEQKKYEELTKIAEKRLKDAKKALAAAHDERRSMEREGLSGGSKVGEMRKKTGNFVHDTLGAAKDKAVAPFKWAKDKVKPSTGGTTNSAK